MTDDGFGKDKHPDDSRSGYDDAELAPEQPDPDSGQRQDDEPTQELSQSGETTQQFSTNPGDSHYQYGNQQYPQQNDSQNVQCSQDWNQYPQDWNQYPQSSDAWGSPDSAGWGQPTSQYEGWTGQYPQQGWDGQTPQNDPNYYFDSAGERGPGWYDPYGTFSLQRGHTSLTYSQIPIATWLRELPLARPLPTVTTSASRSAGSPSAMLPNLSTKANTGLLPLRQFSSLPSAPEHSSI